MTRANTTFGPAPWRQGSWDGRAAGNFIGGGMGSGLIVCTLLSMPAAAPGLARALLLAAGMALVGGGLLSVWFEIGRPWRALHVYFHPRRSWMSREAFVAPLLLATTAVAAWGVAVATWPAVVLALAYLLCQGRIVQAAKGIPAWREPLVVPLLMVTGVVEGAGVFWLAEAARGVVAEAPSWALFGALLALRVALVSAWARRLAHRLSGEALAAVTAAARTCNTVSAVALLLAVAAWVAPAAGAPAQGLAAALAAGAGVMFKWTLVTRAAYNQGFAIAHLPVRGLPRA
jgi:phenylacetyl-CoA:acceptor oxidoreductase subunit 2